MSAPIGRKEERDRVVDMPNAGALGAVAAGQAAWLATQMGSLSPSEQEKVLRAVDASVPVLAKFVGNTEQWDVENKMINALLDGWSKSLEEQKEAAVEAEKKKEVYDQATHAKFNSAAAIAERDTAEKIGAVQQGTSLNSVAASGAAMASSVTASVPTSALPNYTQSEAHMQLVNKLIPLVAAAATMHEDWEKAMALSAAKKTGNIPNGEDPRDDIAARKSSAISGAIMIPMIVSGILAFSAPIAASGLQMEMQVIQGAWSALSPGVSNVSLLLAGNISAAWMTGLIYQTSLENSDKYTTKKEENLEKHNLNFAQAYAEKVVGNLKQMAAIVTYAMANTLDIKGQEFLHLLAQGKVIVLATALALLTKQELGGMTEVEFNGFIDNPQVNLGEGKIANTKKSVIEQIKQALQELPPAERAQLRASLTAYFATSPAIEHLLDQQKVFYEVLSLSSTDEKNETHKHKTDIEKQVVILGGPV